MEEQLAVLGFTCCRCGAIKGQMPDLYRHGEDNYSYGEVRIMLRTRRSIERYMCSKCIDKFEAMCLKWMDNWSALEASGAEIGPIGADY